MALISPADQARLREEFDKMRRGVRLLFFTQTLECETCPQTDQILRELTALSDRISIEEVNFLLEPDRAAPLGIDRVPAIAILAGADPHDAAPPGAAGEAFADTRMRFLGTPSGYEFISLVQAVLLAGGATSRISDATRARLAAVQRPITMRVFTTPS
jgi:alkyl hydroperoxide reductase subunit AhpF